jgi:hypothetical protein
MCAQDHNGRLLLQRAQARHDFEAVELRHLDIQDECVGTTLYGEIDGLETIRRLADDSDAGEFEQPAQTSSHDSVIVGYQHAHYTPPWISRTQATVNLATNVVTRSLAAAAVQATTSSTVALSGKGGTDSRGMSGDQISATHTTSTTRTVSGRMNEWVGGGEMPTAHPISFLISPLSPRATAIDVG